ncbi:MAG: phospho-N-acetylmuramoyl-pentapeptide-transferase [Bacteroidales bacterium]|nr:phospho-N-acetylmuramoyl-pentapeptide-transferase [Bacteroidales bacterium]MDD5990274.1 phospho-N-acetylmuramoyl-pentapeptide-transferase [Paludibacteraceae bacterium]
MLYSLFTHFSDVLGARLWTYISFRAITAGILGLLISIWFGNWFINFMKRHNISETQRDAKIDPFNVAKKGVPTMGGLIVIAAILVPCLLLGKLTNVYMILMLITTVLMGSLGFADDYIKTFKKKKDGLNGWVKIGGQVALGLIVGLTLRFAPMTTMNETVTHRIENNVEVFEKSPEIKSTKTTIPFVKHHNFNYADLFNWLGEENKYRAGWIFFVLLTIFVVAAVSNGANLNDGMDGMCAGNSAIIAIALLILAYTSGSVVWAEYFDVMYIPGSEELVVFLASFIGALVGYLWWNGFPAQVFLGDTGSLTVGGIIGVCAMIIHKELLVPVLCGVFLMESVSVILQTQVYKFYKRKGQHVRVWKRAPLHDHFRTSIEQVLNNDPTCSIFFKGSKNLHHETKIVLRFCIVTLILAAITILTLKIR